MRQSADAQVPALAGFGFGFGLTFWPNERDEHV